MIVVVITVSPQTPSLTFFCGCKRSVLQKTEKRNKSGATTSASPRHASSPLSLVTRIQREPNYKKKKRKSTSKNMKKKTKSSAYSYDDTADTWYVTDLHHDSDTSTKEAWATPKGPLRPRAPPRHAPVDDIRPFVRGYFW